MKKKIENSASKVILLKEARKQFLSLHKILVDEERRGFEKLNGQLTSGQFLNLLINDPEFHWLKKFSSLIVEIDEMLDLDDGFTETMVEKYLSRMSDLVDFNSVDEEFRIKYKEFIQKNNDIALKHSEIKKLFNKE